MQNIKPWWVQLSIQQTKKKSQTYSKTNYTTCFLLMKSNYFGLRSLHISVNAHVSLFLTYILHVQWKIPRKLEAGTLNCIRTNYIHVQPIFCSNYILGKMLCHSDNIHSQCMSFILSKSIAEFRRLELFG